MDGLPARRQRRPGLFLALGLVCALLLSACATVESRRLPTRVADLPGQAEIVDTPFFPQTEAYCGPAALAMVLQQRGVEVSPETLTPLVYLPGRRGSLQVEMLAAARRHGRLAVPIGPSLEAVLREVAGGSPVLVLQNLGLDWAPSWHYAVVVGYDRAAEEFTLRSGPEARMRMGFSVFDRTWTRGGRWAVVLPPAGRTPPGANADAVATALAAFERQNAAAALAYYRAALDRWPDDVRFPFGYANTLYGLGEKAKAGDAWQRLLERHPDHVPALNNLANWRLEQGRFAEAQRLAERAAVVDGPWQTQAKATLREIEQAERSGVGH
jgi:tetratricopeptide (TPR) repeat protein